MPRRTPPAARPDPLEAVRAICTALPEATERLSHGEPAWFVRQRPSFASFADHHHNDRVALFCAAPPGVQDDLVRTRPAEFFVPPYVGGRGWLGIYLDVPVDWDEVAELIAEAYRTVAPRRLVAALDAQRGAGR